MQAPKYSKYPTQSWMFRNIQDLDPITC